MPSETASVRNDTTEAFAFEADFVASLRCIPMAVRFKLDLAGIKLSLRQWSRFTLADRSALLHALCESDDEIAAYRAGLVNLIRDRAGEAPRVIAVESTPAWRESGVVAPAVVRQCAALNVTAPTLAQWAGLSDLRRFTLVKLTREGHDNENFLPAMKEFGLA